MKSLFVWMLIAAAPQWVSSAFAFEKDESSKPHVVAVTGEFIRAGAHTIVLQGDNNAGNAFAFVTKDSANVAGDGKKHHVVIDRMVASDDNDCGWLGVSVSGSTTTENGVKKKTGVVIGNVIEDSPADLAGLLESDVILAIDGAGIGDDITAFVNAVKSKKAGDAVEVSVLRDGEELPFSVTLGTRSDLGEGTWKFDLDPVKLGEIEDTVRLRAKMVVRDDDGNWTFKNLGDVEEIAGLPHNIKMMLPHGGQQRSISVMQDNGAVVIETKVEKDGSTLIVEQRDGGEINVTRVDANGKETAEIYADEVILRDADEEAYDAFKNANQNVFVKLDVDGLADPGNYDFKFDFDVDFDAEDFQTKLIELHADLDTNLGEAKESYHLAMEGLEEALKGLRETHGVAGPLQLLELKGAGKSPMRIGRDFAFFGKANQTFKLQPDGTIEVRIRKGDSELVKVYEDEADFEARDPLNYEKYEDLLLVDE